MFNQVFNYRGGIPERPKGADCKSVGSAFEGSNPSLATIFLYNLGGIKMVRKLKGSSNNNGQSDIIRRAQEMQGRMLAIQEELKDKFVKAEVAGGNVVVEANGQKDIVNITIAQELIDDASTDKDPKILSDLILSAIKDAMQKAEELAEKEMSVVTGGVSIPGLF